MSRLRHLIPCSNTSSSMQLESKQGRIAPWATLIITSFIIVSVGFFMFLALRSPIPAQESSMLHIDYFRSGSLVLNKHKADETMEQNMERLLLGKHKAKFREDGFTCQTEQNSEQCITSNHVRIQITNADHITIYVPSAGSKTLIKTPQKIKIRPYALTNHPSAMQMVSQIQILEGNLNDTAIPTCQHNHTVPAVVFSSGGYAVNTYHALDELLIPLFLTTRHFNSNLQFIVSDYDPRVIPKYRKFLKRLSKFDPIIAHSPSKNKTTIHCFPGAIIGLNYHGNVAVNSTNIPTGYKMADFRRFLYKSYNLNSSNLEPTPPLLISNNRNHQQAPLLVLISRTKSRVILNKNQLVKLMQSVGFEVHVAKDKDMSNLNRFSRLLSNCSVLVGTHGAGLSNSMFMPSGSVLLEVVPLGLRWGGVFCHGEPASRMGLKYVEYLIDPRESSLSKVYAPGDPVLVDTDSVLARGYQEARRLYIDGQNVTIDLSRFRETLVDVLNVLKSIRPNGTNLMDQN